MRYCENCTKWVYSENLGGICRQTGLPNPGGEQACHGFVQRSAGAFLGMSMAEGKEQRDIVTRDTISRLQAELDLETRVRRLTEQERQANDAELTAMTAALADLAAERDSETRWAAQYKAERDRLAAELARAEAQIEEEHLRADKWKGMYESVAAEVERLQAEPLARNNDLENTLEAALEALEISRKWAARWKGLARKWRALALADNAVRLAMDKWRQAIAARIRSETSLSACQQDRTNNLARIRDLKKERDMARDSTILALQDRDAYAAELAAIKATFPPDAAGLLERLAVYPGKTEVGVFDVDVLKDDQRDARAWAKRLRGERA